MSEMQKIRSLFVCDSFFQVGFIDGMKWVSRKTGKIVSQQVIDDFINGKCNE